MALSNDHSVRKHAYEALESSQHIRLIILHPASSADAPLKLTFQQAILSELQGRYEAISYTWGQPNLTYPLYVSDGTHVLVTENLDRALRYLRHSHKDRALWVDAACINQADDVEKGTQIPLMGQIYQNAETVLAWLDPGSAVSRFQNLELTLRKMGNVSRNRRQDILSGMMEPDGEGVTALFWELFWEVSELLRLPWFARRWIIQEVAFNSEVRLIYGDVELSWTRFVGAISILSTLNLETANPETRVWSSVARLARLWRHHALFEQFSITGENYPDTDILKLMDDFDQHGCADPRDRIFALYNMASNMRSSTVISHQHDIVMDIEYSLDLQQTYESFALACIRAGKLNTIIEAVLSRQHSARPQGWASWAPDWRVSWLEPVILPVPVIIPHIELQEWPPGSIHIGIVTSGLLLDGPYMAYPVIMGRAVGNTLAQQYFSLSPKLNGMNAGFNALSNSISLLDMLRYIVETRSGLTANKRAMLEEELHRLRNQVFDATLSDQDLHLVNLDASQSSLSMIIGPGNNMFLFQLPGTERRSMGYSSAHLELGDKLIPLVDNTKRHKIPRLRDRKLRMVLILRDAGTINIKPSRTFGGLWQEETPRTAYRLIGSGYVYDTVAIKSSFGYSRDFQEFYVV
jgi:hypothetical protein